MYRLSWPFASFLSKYLGVNLSIKINVDFDAETEVYIATSPDVKGLVIEADSFNNLQKEVNLYLPELINLESLAQPTTKRYIAMDFC